MTQRATGKPKHPPASSPEVRRRMLRTPRTNTPPEIALRRELHRRGLRYRVDEKPAADLRTRADVVFKRARVAVYMDGCYWHSCPKHGTLPHGENAEWWRSKLAANVERDRAVTAALSARGWLVIRLWEHEAASEAADRVEAAVRGRT